MAGNTTFTMIKPLAVKHGHIGHILSKINDSGFKIIALRYTQLKRDDAKKFYAVHKDKPFFNDLVKFMSSGPIVVSILYKENAVEDFRKLIGSTDPAEAEFGTIRQLYATSKTANAIHGSDSDENVVIESNFFFSMRDRFFPDEVPEE